MFLSPDKFEIKNQIKLVFYFSTDVKKRYAKRDTRCSACKQNVAFKNARILSEKDGETRYICVRCQTHGPPKTLTFACTVCHSTKEKGYGLRFRAKNYNILHNPSVLEAMRLENRLASKDEWICRKCNTRLRKKSKYTSVQGCIPCRNGNKCVEKRQLEIPSPISTVMEETPVSRAEVNVLNSPKEPVVITRDRFWLKIGGEMAALRSYEEMERYILDTHREQIESIAPISSVVGNQHVHQYREDLAAKRQCPQVPSLDNPFAVQCTGNGNCFFNAMSLLAYGNEDHALEMRLRVVIEGVQNRDRYLDENQLSQGFPAESNRSFVETYLLQTVTPNIPIPVTRPGDSQEIALRNTQDQGEMYNSELFDMRLDRHWAGVWQFHQAATVLRCVVQGLYPGQDASSQRMHFHREFLPIEDELNSLPKVHILYCSSGGAGRSLNHFVPVVERSLVGFQPPDPAADPSQLPSKCKREVGCDSDYVQDCTQMEVEPDNAGLKAGSQKCSRKRKVYQKREKTTCTMCKCEGQNMKKFCFENYPKMSDFMRKSVLNRKNRILDGQEFVCKTCDVFIAQNKVRTSKTWAFDKSQNELLRDEFLKELGKFPEFTCSVCHKTKFRKSVVKLNFKSFDMENEIVAQCLDPKFHVPCADGKLWIDRTCQKLLRKAQMPDIAVANSLEIPNQPDQLKDLTRLEVRCISLQIPFMHIESVRMGGKRIHGPCVNVPATLTPILQVLPRIPEELKTILVKLKRRLNYRQYYLYNTIRPEKVMNALIWLKCNNPLYTDVLINDQWYAELEKHAELSALVQDADVEGDCVEKGSDDELDLEAEQKCLDSKAEITALPYGTCVEIEKIDEAVYSIAPGEGHKPVYIVGDEKFETSCFPNFYPKGVGSFNTERETNIPLRKYVVQKLENINGQFAQDMEWIFAMQNCVELSQLNSSKSIATRINKRCCIDGTKLTAGHVKDNERRLELLRKDRAFHFMRHVRGTPSYWQEKMYETTSMFNCLGKPTWFLTLSAAENLWPELIVAIGKMQGRSISTEEALKMPTIEKQRLLHSNPVTTVRMWEHRLNAFVNEYLTHKVNGPLGHITNFVVKIEFQARGSPHAHTLLWAENAPEIDVDSDEDICEYIDEFLCGEFPTEWFDAPADTSLEELQYLLERVQYHTCSSSCRKHKNAKCRFQYPRPVCPKTIIARPDESESVSIEQKKKNAEILRKVHDEMNEMSATSLTRALKKCDVSQQEYDVCMKDKQENFGILSKVHSQMKKDSSEDFKEILCKCNISEEEYVNILKISETGSKVILKRDPYDVRLNNYNNMITTLFRANMDLQYVVDSYSAITYVMSYVLKCENGMSDLMKQIAREYHTDGVKKQMTEIVRTFNDKREVGLPEAVCRLNGTDLFRKSLSVIYVSPNLEAKRDSMLIPVDKMKEKDDGDTDIYQTGIHDRYVMRPDKLEDMCLADFAVSFDVVYTAVKAPKSEIITLKNGLGMMRKRQKKSVMRSYKPKAGTEDFFQALLLLFLPYREEKELLGSHESYYDHYVEVQETVKTNADKHHFLYKEFEDAIEKFNKADDDGQAKSAWDAAIFPNEPQKEIEIRESHLTKRYREEAKKGKLPVAEFLQKVRGSNVKQKEIVLWVRDHVKNQIRQMKAGVSPQGFKIVLTGAGGTGKSHVISLINHVVADLFGRTRTSDPKDVFGEYEPEKLITMLTAMTGTAAFNIGGTTIHSGLLLYKENLDNQSRNVLQSQLRQLQLLVVDEVSMMGSKQLRAVNQRLNMIKTGCLLADETARNFGNVNILLCGDLYQLPAIMQTAIFKMPAIKSVSDFQEPLWADFKLHELTQIMRQKDREFGRLLSSVRVEVPEANSNIDMRLRDRELLLDFHDPEYPRKAVHVFAQNAAVDAFNERMLAEIKNHPLVVCHAEDKILGGSLNCPKFPDKPSDTGNLKQTLKIKVGARVVLTQNLDVSDGLTNGVYGTIRGIEQTREDGEARVVFVQFDHPRVGEKALRVHDRQADFSYSVAIQRTEATFPLRRGRNTCQAMRKQFPLFLAWGVTIHKVQGMTMKEIVVNMDPSLGRFDRGQAYVGFSRVTEYDKLHIVNYDRSQIKVNKDVDAEMKRMRENELGALPPAEFLSLKKVLGIGHVNIQGLMTTKVDKTIDLNQDELIQHLHVLCLSETHLCHDKPLQGFEVWPNEMSAVFRKDRRVENGGGVLIAVRSPLVAAELNFLPKSSQLEIVGGRVFYQETFVMNVFCVYVSPRTTNLTEYTLQIERCLGPYFHERTAILGDFNENLLNPEMVRHFSSMFHRNGFEQVISEPTCIFGSQLDHIYLNFVHSGFGEVSRETYYSDHDVIVTAIPFVFA